MNGYLTPKQLALLIGKHYQTVYDWARQGTIPHTRLGSRLRFFSSLKVEDSSSQSALVMSAT
jgi:excisionase family DNA binding protein